MLKNGDTFEVKLKLNQQQRYSEEDIPVIFDLMKEIGDYYTDDTSDGNSVVVLDPDIAYYPEEFNFLNVQDIQKVKDLMHDNPENLKLKLRVEDVKDENRLESMYFESLTPHKMIIQKLLSMTFVLSISPNDLKSKKIAAKTVKFGNQTQSLRKKEGNKMGMMNMNMNFDALNIKETKDYGVNILNHQISYDGNTYADGMLVTGPTLDMPMYVMPVVDVVPGDVIEYEDEPLQILEVKTKEIKAVSLVNGQKQVIVKKNILGMGSFFKKVVNPMTLMMPNNQVQASGMIPQMNQNPLMAMMLMKALSNQEETEGNSFDFKQLMMLQMFSNLGNSNNMIANMFGQTPQNIPVEVAEKPDTSKNKNHQKQENVE